ncbi:MAG: hypothetical protein H5T50_02015 [Nitrososphaeria archaeon]|nr:hypothetical protein [Nitrososphaeria archaeon]
MQKYDFAIIGVGTAGKRILEKISYKISDGILLALDDTEWRLSGNRVKEIRLNVNFERTSKKIKLEAYKVGKSLVEEVDGVRNIVIVSGLGGVFGSSAAPIVANVLRESGKRVLGISIMPFKFEKSRLFRAAVALRKMKIACDGVIVIGNGEFIEKAPKTPLFKAYELENEWIGNFISKLFDRENIYGINSGETYRLASEGNTVLGVGVGEGTGMAEEATTRATLSLRRQSGSDAREALVYVVGWKEISLGDVSTIVTTFRGITCCEGEIKVGYYPNGERSLTVYALAAVTETKFDEWDPVQKILKDRELDFDVYADMSVDCEFLGIKVLD